MLVRHGGTRALAALGAFALVTGLSGCAAKVTRKDFDAEVSRLREEVQSGDRQLAARIDSTNQRVAEHDRRLDALEQELQAFRSEYNVSMERMKGMIKFNVPVHFEFASADLREADRPVLDRFAAVAKEYYPGATITVEGFTDPAGSAAYNKRLGLNRATSVKEYLVTSGGIADTQLKTVSYGESQNRQVVPGARGPGEVGLPNRRVALVIDYAAAGASDVALP